MEVFDFIITDPGSDGYGTAMKQIVVNRDTGSDTTGGWTEYIDGAYITDGVTTLLGIIEGDRILWGSGTSAILSTFDGGTMTCTVSVFLNPALPAGADNKVIAFSLDAETDIISILLDQLAGFITGSPVCI